MKQTKRKVHRPVIPSLFLSLKNKKTKQKVRIHARLRINGFRLFSFGDMSVATSKKNLKTGTSTWKQKRWKSLGIVFSFIPKAKIIFVSNSSERVQ